MLLGERLQKSGRTGQLYIGIEDKYIAVRGLAIITRLKWLQQQYAQ